MRFTHINSKNSINCHININLGFFIIFKCFRILQLQLFTLGLIETLQIGKLVGNIV